MVVWSKEGRNMRTAPGHVREDLIPNSNRTGPRSRVSSGPFTPAVSTVCIRTSPLPEPTPLARHERFAFTASRLPRPGLTAGHVRRCTETRACVLLQLQYCRVLPDRPALHAEGAWTTSDCLLCPMLSPSAHLHAERQHSQPPKFTGIAEPYCRNSRTPNDDRFRLDWSPSFAWRPSTRCRPSWRSSS